MEELLGLVLKGNIMLDIIAATTPTVHTSGINWQSVIAIVGGTITIMSIVFGLFAKVISDKITNAINKFRIDVVTQLDLRLTSVEAKLNGIRNKQEE